MRKLAFLIGLLLGAVLSSNAQDLITTRDGTDIKAKILEVTPTEVKYKKFSNLDGPVFTISKSDILIVRYENGENEVFADSKAASNGYIPNTDIPIVDGMKYREYKDFYDPRLYERQSTDPYSRAWAGIASFFIPGLGQAIDGEWGRAAAFFSSALILSGIQYSDTSYNAEEGYYTTGTLGTIAGYASLAVTIWSIIDAVRVAKIKNMYYQDLKGQRAAVDFSVEPFLDCTPANAPGELTASTGLSLKIRF